MNILIIRRCENYRTPPPQWAAHCLFVCFLKSSSETEDLKKKNHLDKFCLAAFFGSPDVWKHTMHGTITLLSLTLNDLISKWSNWLMILKYFDSSESVRSLSNCASFCLYVDAKRLLKSCQVVVSLQPFTIFPAAGSVSVVTKTNKEFCDNKELLLWIVFPSCCRPEISSQPLRGEIHISESWEWSREAPGMRWSEWEPSLRQWC